jgi:hypothetical protein
VTKFGQGFLFELSKAAFVGPSNSNVGAFVQKLRSAFPQAQKTRLEGAMRIAGAGQKLKSPVVG